MEEDERSLQQEILEAKENIETGHRVDGSCACPRCVEIWLGDEDKS